MDVSDGLAGDLGKLCRASQVSANVEVQRIPLSAAARVALERDPALIQPILTNGDDFEVLATIPAEKIEAFGQSARQTGLAIAAIGIVTEGSEPPVFLQDGRVLNFARRSYSHF
jgi:thiamine-monophosphate kinase